MKVKRYLFTSGQSVWALIAFPVLLLLSPAAFAQTGPEADAGEDFTACENSIVVNGSAQNYETVQWTTNGDGAFQTPELLSSEYIPGPMDVSNGSVEVCLTAFAGGDQATDCVTITIVGTPMIELNVENVEICYFEAYTFDEVEVENYSVIQWFTTNGGGNFDNETIPNPTYFPSPTVDYAQGCVEIVAIAQGLDPCEVFAQDEMTLCFVPNPQVDLGGEVHNVCFGENYTFADATATGTSSIQWFSLTGGGYFENPNSINATYVPDPEFDYPQGCIFVGVSVEPISPCTGTVEEFAQICFVEAPEADAGADATILFNETFTPSPVVQNQDEVLWETSGDGNFNDPTLVSPTYTPGIADMQSGSVVLTINAFAAGCSAATDELFLTVITQQTIELPQGPGGFSTYVNTSGLSFEEIVAPISGDIIFAQNGTQIFWPEYNINTIEDPTEPEGFKVKMEGSSTLFLAGTLSSQTIDLPAGWSILPVPVYCNVDTQFLIDQLGSDLIIVTEIDGNGILWPDGGLNTLPELVPGKAYSIKLANPGQVVFPVCE